ncbi:MAG: SdpI family protein [Burkholderiaceae bacterium]
MSNLIYVLSTNGVLFVLSIVFYLFPPKKINNWYGYRTYKTMQNQKIWDFANGTFNKAFLFYSFLSLAGGLLLNYGATGTLTWQPMALVFLSLIVCIVKTENQLKENFTDEGKSKKKH